MNCKPFCYPHQNNYRTGFIFPFVGGLLIGGLVAPYFIKSNKPYYPPYYPYSNYIPTYQTGNYTYPYANGFYHY